MYAPVGVPNSYLVFGIFIQHCETDNKLKKVGTGESDPVPKLVEE